MKPSIAMVTLAFFVSAIACTNTTRLVALRTTPAADQRSSECRSSCQRQRDKSDELGGSPAAAKDTYFNCVRHCPDVAQESGECGVVTAGKLFCEEHSEVSGGKFLLGIGAFLGGLVLLLAATIVILCTRDDCDFAN